MATKIKVLVIDDDKQMPFMLRSCIKLNHMDDTDVEIAQSFDSGMVMATKDHTLILCDFNFRDTLGRTGALLVPILQKTSPYAKIVLYTAMVEEIEDANTKANIYSSDEVVERMESFIIEAKENAEKMIKSETETGNKAKIELEIIDAIKAHHFECEQQQAKREEETVDKFDARYIKRIGLISAVGVAITIFLSCGILYGMFWLGGKMENHERRIYDVERIVYKCPPTPEYPR